jgi:hypothetical protein
MRLSGSYRSIHCQYLDKKRTDWITQVTVSISLLPGPIIDTQFEPSLRMCMLPIGGLY